MTTTVLLVRHGQTESNVTGYFMGWSDEDINKLGYAQVTSLASRLQDRPIASAYTSPLRRAYNTASILAQPHGLKLEVMDELIEIKLGDWQGLHMDEISRRWPELWKQSRTDPSEVTMPNGESFRQVAERAVRAFERIVAANQGRQALIVSHEAVLKMIIIHALGASTSIYRRFELSNASLSIIEVKEGKARLITLNDTSHLDQSHQASVK
jgi:broad specificity phosphatase PhoE